MIKKMRAVYYCRVSTDDENQTSSIINQKEESIKTIKDNKWELVDEYIDSGKTQMDLFEFAMDLLVDSGVLGKEENLK